MTPLPFSSTQAHPGDPLPVHLERVAQRAAASIAPSARPEARLIAFLAGLFHDIGKATPYFQDYLLKTHRKTKYTPHAKTGAVLSWWYTGELGVALWIRIAVFIAVLRHHGALSFDSWRQPIQRIQGDMEDEDEALLTQLLSLDLAGIHRWLCEVVERHSDFGLPTTPGNLSLEQITNYLMDQRIAGQSKLRRAFQSLDDAVGFIAGFGGLLAVDKIDAAIQGDAISRQPLPFKAVTVFKARQFNPTNSSPLDERRSAIAEEVKQVWLEHLQEVLLTLTAPTGSGKTLTVLDAALAVRQLTQEIHGYTPRIIYCLPFTSVIDQNHRVFRDVLKANGLAEREDILLKHHHLVEGLFRTADAEYLPDGAGQLLTETWQSEIVVTTFHQLLSTLLSNANGSLKRAGQLTGSIVLMDEVQALPLCYWESLRCLFRSAARALGARFLLLTATRPLIFRPEDARELLPSHPEHFKALSRVRLLCHHRTSVTLEDFADQLIVDHTENPRSILVILNRRRAVGYVFDRLRLSCPKTRLIALSTNLTPRDRRARIRLIQRLSRNKQPCIVIATQLVEAGVDISFPVVHRDLAPLDSIVQSAGRCNRHAADESLGEVHMWNLHTKRQDGKPEALWQRIYDAPLIEATTEVLGKQDNWEESDFLELSQRYFETCWRRMDQTRVDEWLTAGNFEKLERDFKLIPEGLPTTSLFVISVSKNRQMLRPSDIELWERYAEIYSGSDLSPLQKEQQFRQIRHAFYERVIQVYPPPRPDPDNPVIRIEAIGGAYTRETGYIGLPEEAAVCLF